MKIGIDIGGSNIRIGLYHEKLLLKYEKHSSRFLNNEHSRLDFIEMLKLFIRKNTNVKEIKYIAITIPGTISSDNSCVISSPNLKALNNWPIKNSIENTIGCEVYLIKDVNALLAYDIYSNNIDFKHGNVCAFYLGTGLGNAIMIDSKILKGTNNSSGELGHIPLNKSSISCNCGSFYCAEIVVSGIRLEAIANDLNIEISSIFDNSYDVVNEFIDNFAAIIAIELNIIDPKFVIISGGVCNMNNFPQEQLLEYLNKYLRKPNTSASYEFYFTKNDQDQGPLGAILCASMIRKDYNE